MLGGQWRAILRHNLECALVRHKQDETGRFAVGAGFAEPTVA
jgi:hypothetical protein